MGGLYNYSNPTIRNIVNDSGSMGLFIPNRKVTPRRFSYEPRHYDPRKDENLKRRIRIQSRAQRRRSPIGLIYFIALLLFAIYIYNTLGS